MKYMIATINQTGTKGLLGYRICDLKTGEVRDLPKEELRDAILNKQIKIENLEVGAGRELVGVNGSVDRYTKIMFGEHSKALANRAVVIVFKQDGEKEQNKFMCIDFEGKRAVLTETDLVRLSNTKGLGIANGKIVNGRISAISGEYNKIKKNKASKQNNVQNDIKIHEDKYKERNMTPFKFEVINGSAEIDWAPRRVGGTTVIPHFVRSIGQGVFSRHSIYKVKVEGVENSGYEGLSSIGDNAFKGCAELREIDMGKSVERIGNEAFSGCLNIKEIKVPTTLRELGAGAFSSCVNLEKVDLTSRIHSIEKESFLDCVVLSSAVLPKGLKVIGERAFENTKLQDIKIPNTVEVIGDGAFAKTKIKKLIIPDSIQQIGDGILDMCDELEYIEVPMKVANDPKLKGKLSRYNKGLFGGVKIKVRQ